MVRYSGTAASGCIAVIPAVADADPDPLDYAVHVTAELVGRGIRLRVRWHTAGAANRARSRVIDERTTVRRGGKSHRRYRRSDDVVLHTAKHHGLGHRRVLDRPRRGHPC